MPQFAANLSLLYNEHSFLDRFAAAAGDGFRAVEFLFPYAHAAAELRNKLNANSLQQVLFNAPPGNWEGGERGLASLPGRQEEFRQGLSLALQYAEELECSRLHVMAGLRDTNIPLDVQRRVYLDNLAFAAETAVSHGVTILIEPINLRDMPGYFLNRQEDAHAVCEEIGAPNLAIQFDIYHCQIVQGDVTARLRQYLGQIAHIQIAGVPARSEPDQGELNYPYLFRLLDELGYEGWIGCEYWPRGATSDGLGWLQDWQKTQVSGWGGD